MALAWLDYTILGAFLCISLAIGVYHALTGGRQKTTEEFVLANREQSVLPLSLSLAMSYLSALALVGNTAEMYTRGTLYMVNITASIVVSGIIAHRVILPWLYPLRLLSVYEYLELRFSSKLVRLMASLTGAVWSIIYMGFVTVASALAMQTATDINANYWIPIVAVVSTVYTAVGGMRAVVWTDVFQCLVMLSGIVTIITKGLMVTGGFKNVMAINEDRGRLEWFNLDPNPETRMTTWGTLGLGVYFVFAGSVQQGTYQRLTATKQLKASNWVITVNVALAVLTLLLTCFMGILAFAFFGQRNCDPLLNGEVGNPNQLQGLYVQNLFKHNPGFEGFFLATINSGALSTVSSSMSGTSTNILEDIFKWKLPSLTDYKATIVLKCLVIGVGCAMTSIAYLSVNFQGPLTQLALSFLGAAGGPLLGLFFLGGCFRSAEWIGATCGGAVSLAVSLWICFSAGSVVDRVHLPLPPLPTNGCALLDPGNHSTSWSNASTSYFYLDNLTLFPTEIAAVEETPYEISGIEHLYAVSFVWYTPIGAIVCLVLGITISCLVKCVSKKETKVSPNLLINWRTVFCCSEDIDCRSRRHNGNNPECLEMLPAAI